MPDAARSQSADYEYDFGTRTLVQIQEDVAEFWTEFETSPDLRSSIAKKGIDLAEVEKYKSQLIHVDQKGAGLTGAETVLVLVLLPAGKRVASDIWKRVILPRIEARWGVRAVGHQRKPKPK